MNNLLKLRKEKNVRVVDLAAALGISRKHYYDLEKGDRRLNKDHIEKLTDIFNCTADELFGVSEGLDLLKKVLSEAVNSEKDMDILAKTLNLTTNELRTKLQSMSTLEQFVFLNNNGVEFVFTNDAGEEDYELEYCQDSVVKKSRRTPTLPIIGTVTAGPNGLAYSEPLGEERVDEGDINGGAHYFWLYVKGDSMIGEGIMPGDLALVREQPDIESGELAVVIVDGEEGTLKRVYKKESSIVLQSANAAYPPRIFSGPELNSICIVGKVKITKRKY